MENSYITTDKAYTFEVYINDLAMLFNSFSFLKRETIGYSVLKKPLYAVKFGTGTKKIIITAAHHGTEWITSMLVMSLLAELCKNFSSGDKDTWNDKTFYFIPMVNPDGINLSIDGKTDNLPPHIKNRLYKILSNGNFKDNWQANIRGIDLNHNYDASFQLGKEIQLKEGIIAPAPTKYSGEYPESEPETKAIVSFTKKILPDIVVAYHSQGEEIFYKYQGKCAPSAYEIAKKMSNASGYKLVLADGLTDCTGYKDWVIEKFNIPAFTIEVGKGKNPVPITQFKKIFDDNKKIINTL